MRFAFFKGVFSGETRNKPGRDCFGMGYRNRWRKQRQESRPSMSQPRSPKRLARFFGALRSLSPAERVHEVRTILLNPSVQLEMKRAAIEAGIGFGLPRGEARGLRQLLNRLP